MFPSLCQKAQRQKHSTASKYQQHIPKWQPRPPGTCGWSRWSQQESQGGLSQRSWKAWSMLQKLMFLPLRENSLTVTYYYHSNAISMQLVSYLLNSCGLHVEHALSSPDQQHACRFKCQLDFDLNVENKEKTRGIAWGLWNHNQN